MSSSYRSAELGLALLFYLAAAKLNCSCCFKQKVFHLIPSLYSRENSSYPQQDRAGSFDAGLVTGRCGGSLSAD